MPRFGDFEQYFNNSGDILNGGKLYFYESGTTTPKTTYADINQTTANPNPVILTAAGRQGNIWFSGVAKVVLTTSADVILQTLDPVGDTDVNAQFSAWVPTFSYAQYSIVLYSGVYYASLVNNNLGNTPDSSPSQWQLAIEFFLESQTLVTAGQIAVGDATTGLTGTSTTDGYLLIGDSTDGVDQINTTVKGTIAVGNGTTTTTLAVGANGRILSANSGTGTGLEWATFGSLYNPGFQEFTSSGSYSIPASAVYVYVEAIGGGGGGGSGTGTGASGGGGGGFNFAVLRVSDLTGPVTVTIGAGGTAGTAGGAGGNGGNTTFGTYLTARGGSGGQGNSGGNQVGSASGDYTAGSSSSWASGGGGGVNTGPTGITGGSCIKGGAGGGGGGTSGGTAGTSLDGGNGGAGGNLSSSAGTQPGGGGGGTNNGSGSVGGAGRVRVWSW